MSKRIKITIIITLAVLTLGILEYNGYIWHTEIFTSSFQIKGLDVSHYQNKIDWELLSNSNYKFVYIKATEGQGMKDETFEYNWNNAQNNGFLVGAYHFFTTSSSGEEQAYNFTETVPTEKALPPVIDIEINTSKDKSIVRENLSELVAILSETYGKTPILYVTYETYNAYIVGHYKECDIWIRDIVKPPKLKDDREWKLWQYCNRGRVKGVKTYVDINVFNGSEEDLLQLSK